MTALIKHQKQPCPVSCMSACVAMVAGIPAGTVRRDMHKRYREQGMSLRHMLDELNIPFTSFHTVEDGKLEYVGAYLCTMPSLNIQAGTHAVVIEVTASTWHVLDPNRGKKGRKFYVRRGVKARNGVELGSFTVDAFICASWLRERSHG